MSLRLDQTLAAATHTLVPHSDSPRADAEILLAQQLSLSRAQLFARGSTVLTPDEVAAYQQRLARRSQGEPVAYITGSQGFWTLDLQVSPAVLVPRPETELLVEWSLECLKHLAEPCLADLGTGSGCIALALAHERADAQVQGVDLSPQALALASLNARRLGLERVRWVPATFSEFLESARDLDLIVSNPPYIAAADPHLPALRHEPQMALTDGADGLRWLAEIIASASRALRPGGWLLLEHGYDQATAVRGLLAAAGFAQVQSRRDLAGHERASGGQRP